MSLSLLRHKYQSQFKNVLDFDLLLAGAIRRPKEFLYSHNEYELTPAELARWRKYFRLYRAGYSIAAILGHKEFYGLDFFVNKHVLVPRPETELIVELATQHITTHQLQTTNYKLPTTLIDIGTGSGCIPISILKHLESEKQPTQYIKTIAIDISSQALRVAKKNARIHAAKIKFIQGNLLQPLLDYSYNLTPNTYNLIITANLPYLTEKQFRDEPSIQREPKLALVAKHQGLALYEELCRQIKKLIIQYPGITVQAWFEIDPAQNQRIQKVVKRHLKNATIKIFSDLSGRDRLAAIS